MAPNTTFFKKDGKDLVFVVEIGRDSQREVILEPELRTEYVIEEGIYSGDYIIRNSNANEEGLKEGVKIRVE